MNSMLRTIISSDKLHARWLNSLSYMENCGARKIAACEHPTLVREEMLKHAAEEFRHAHYLKRQIPRVSPEDLPTYQLPFLLGGIATLHYLDALDVQTVRYLQAQGVRDIRVAAYLLVTYAIEVRASELYPFYDGLLRQAGSRVTVKSILLEEQEHLNEMKAGLQQLPSGGQHALIICGFEAELYRKWVLAVATDCKTNWLSTAHEVYSC